MLSPDELDLLEVLMIRRAFCVAEGTTFFCSWDELDLLRTAYRLDLDLCKAMFAAVGLPGLPPVPILITDFHDIPGRNMPVWS